ncbi:class I SAM-dependent methyltransferase [Kitasatospora aureofaciens]|uniref:class I SAM-dependent methyltransferase n=1 Tax=Kitasatospora aureofaciens TaxID=1894 RepID=UPI00068E2317|nr:class I SAM-dependent methyltransferase [Kitasatospora aureofaciens]
MSPPTTVDAYVQAAEHSGYVMGDDDVLMPLYPDSIESRQGDLLRHAVRAEGAQRTVETGMGNAISTLYVCDGLRRNGLTGPRHVVLDPHQAGHYHCAGLRAVRTLGFTDLVDFRPRDSSLELPRMVDEGRSMDLGFVDGDHRFESVFADLHYLDRLIRPGGLVLVDDYQLPAVRDAIAYFTANLGWTLEDVHRIAVLRRPYRPCTPPWYAYVPFHA